MDVAPKVQAESPAPAEPPKPACKPCCRGKRLKKPSELSIYECPADNVEYELVEEQPGAVENGVRYVRTSLSPYYGTVAEAKEFSQNYLVVARNQVTAGVKQTTGETAFRS
ncbi:hypothetical protein IscW_ISCW019622 [Ixodes scapularis]|uniref:Uncharacterized protein n=1 Tax=Ixodes scapularis TaxID=6945 RepID=B7PW97_IXOSC|nr:hypothetical protein IscW_ISCW019622 [Ixodes scapularis]|eukprot:XP_002409511.1 hypothetical protein IscW_ISCW019622 [Ixodes scapularis]